MNIHEPLATQFRPRNDQFAEASKDQWLLLRNGVRIGSSTYVRRDTAENALKQRHFGSSAIGRPLPEGYEISQVNR